MRVAFEVAPASETRLCICRSRKDRGDKMSSWRKICLACKNEKLPCAENAIERAPLARHAPITRTTLTSSWGMGVSLTTTIPTSATRSAWRSGTDRRAAQTSLPGKQQRPEVRAFVAPRYTLRVKPIVTVAVARGWSIAISISGLPHRPCHAGPRIEPSICRAMSS